MPPWMKCTGTFEFFNDGKKWGYEAVEDYDTRGYGRSGFRTRIEYQCNGRTLTKRMQIGDDPGKKKREPLTKYRDNYPSPVFFQSLRENPKLSSRIRRTAAGQTLYLLGTSEPKRRFRSYFIGTRTRWTFCADTCLPLERRISSTGYLFAATTRFILIED